MNSKLEREAAALRARLHDLALNHGLVALKAGTEVEDMTFSEIGVFRELTQGFLPVYVKIGGPEARTDMRKCLALGVDGLIAPMIESAFALQKFIESLYEVAGTATGRRIRKGINLETKTALDNLDEILGSELALELHQVTAARSDLSASLATHAEDSEVIELCRQVVDFAHYLGLTTSVGGKIVPDTIEGLLRRLKSDCINTRHMVLSCETIAPDPARAVQEALRFEVELYRFFAGRFSSRSALHVERMKQLERRLQKRPVLQN